MNVTKTKSTNKTLIQFCRLTLALAAMVHGSMARAALPPLPNVRFHILPAELLITWDAMEGADYYVVDRGNQDRRWIPVSRTRELRFRDSDFTALPAYYQMGAVNAAGVATAFAEYLVTDVPSNNCLNGISVRPLSDTGVAIRWMIAGTVGADAMIELGTNLAQMTLVGTNPEIKSRHEFELENLEPNTSYIYRLTSTSANGSAFSYWNTFSTRPYAPPAPMVVSLSQPSPVLEAAEDIPVRFTLTANSPGGAPLPCFVLSNMFISWAGTLRGTPPDLVYESKPDTYGQDSLTCYFTDGVETISVPLLVNISPIHDAPIAADLSFTFTEDRRGPLTLAGRTLEANPALEYFIVDAPTNGVLVRHPLYQMVLEYIPNTNFSGFDHLTYRCFDGQSTGNVATVRLRVSPVNDRPIALPQSVTVPAGVTTRIVLTASDPDGLRDYLMLTTITAPAHGNVGGWYGAFDYVDYRPADGYFGPDSYTYRVTDPSGLDATATVSINVVPPNYPPLANSSSTVTEYGVPLNVTLTGSDPDGDALTFSVVSQPTGGTLSGTPPNLVFTPTLGFSGLTGFLFKANDGKLDSVIATNLILVGAANAPLNPPTGLIATAVSRMQINLMWMDNSGRESGYKIERSTDNRKWTQIAVVNRNVRNYSSLLLKKSTTYYHRVRASNEFGNSGYSNTAVAQTPK